MSSQEIIDRLAACGISVAANGHELLLTPADRVTAVHAQFVREHKAELLAALRSANDPGPSLQTAVRCCDCRRSTPALAGSPVSWHVCGLPRESKKHGQWGLAEHYCGSWEAHPDRRHQADTGDANEWQS